MFDVKHSEIFIDINEQLNDFASESLHCIREREKRLSLAVSLNRNSLGKMATVHDVFFVDRGHPDGPELHAVTNKGIVFIFNESKFVNHKSGALITVLIARYGQVYRLYNSCGEEMPEWIAHCCRRNEKSGYNEM